MPTKKTYNYDQYVSDAKKEPFPLEGLPGRDEVLEIPQPTSIMSDRFDDGFRKGDMALMMWALGGDHADELQAAFAGAPREAVKNIILDMGMHFGLFNEAQMFGPSGGSRFESDPRKIERLLKQGWTVGKAGPTSDT